jgi:Cd2+/Zn2+-exporting ATPase
VINQNFLFGIFFIIIGLGLAAFKYIGPITAAIMHNVGSLIVVFNSARLVRHGEELDPYDHAPAAQQPPTTTGPTPAPRLQPA